MHNSSRDCHTASSNWNNEKTVCSGQTAHDRYKSYWWTELKGDQATDQCQSLESKKTFRLQIKKNNTKLQQKTLKRQRNTKHRDQALVFVNLYFLQKWQ